LVDHEKAFDRADWKKLMHALRKISVDWKDRILMGDLYTGQRVKIKIITEVLEPEVISRGV